MLPVEDDRQIASEDHLSERKEQLQQAMQTERETISLVSPS